MARKTPAGYTITRLVAYDGYVTYRMTTPDGFVAVTVYRREAIAAACNHARTGTCWTEPANPLPRAGRATAQRTRHPDTVKPATPAEVLREAAAYVRDNGYYMARAARDNYDWRNAIGLRPPASAEGAIAFVIYGVPVQMPTPADDAVYRLFRQAINAYCDQLERREDEDGFFIESTTTEGVSADLDAAASLWESTHATASAHPGDHS